MKPDNKIKSINDLFKETFGPTIDRMFEESLAKFHGFKTIEEYKAFLKKQKDVQEDLSDLLK